ncbi:hypothetical protein OG203_27025 [Nocardia sp. NBC_01499]|uniref:hypothetical protein n=1 Tax=Nocardia sp. NBC_01499 TaxID=2903597 RepID=UPI0038670529
MTRVTSNVILPKEEWTTIQVPYGSKLVWARRWGSAGSPGPVPLDYIKLSFSSADQPLGMQTCLIRVGTEQSPGSQNPDPNAGTSGISDAVAFINNELFLWWKIDMFGNGGGYPPNRP